MLTVSSNQQLTFFLYSVIIGIFLGLIYDIFVILRKIFPNTASWVIAIEDVLFCFIATLTYVIFIFTANFGIPRLFSFIAIMSGFVFYKCTFSKIIVLFVIKILKLFRIVFGRIFKIICKPLLYLIGFFTLFFKSFLCRITICAKKIKKLFIFSKKRNIMYSCISKGLCFETEEREGYISL